MEKTGEGNEGGKTVKGACLKSHVTQCAILLPRRSNTAAIAVTSLVGSSSFWGHDKNNAHQGVFALTYVVLFFSEFRVISTVDGSHVRQGSQQRFLRVHLFFAPPVVV